MKKLLPILFLLFSLQAMAQRGPYLDSLWSVWSDVKQPDTVRLKAMYDFAWDGFLFSQPDSSFYFSKLMFDHAAEKGLKDFQARALNLQFSYFLGKGDLVKAEEANNKGMLLWQAIGDRLGLAANCTNFGILYQIQGNFPRAIEYFTLSLKYNEEVQDKSGIGTSLHNIGHIHQEEGNFDKAVDYYQRSLKIRESIGEKFGVATSQINLGSVYQQMGEYDKAEQAISKALALHTELGNKPGIAAALGNMGMICFAKEELDKAEKYYAESMMIQEELGDKLTLAISHVNLGKVSLAKKDHQKAIGHFMKALALSREIGDATGIRDASGSLSIAYKETGKFREALEMHELYMDMWDSVNNKEVKQDLMRQEFKYEYEKKATADSIHAAEEKKVVEAQFRQEQTTRYALYIGLALVLVFGIFMYKRFRESQRQKAIIEDQKMIVEQKQLEILDSIHYARRIQRSLMPSDKYIDKQINRLNKS